MKGMFYPRLALDAMRKNRRLYLPYLLTCVGMVMMYYIIVFLRYDEALAAVKGGGTMGAVLGIGQFVIAVFACIFLFYTGSFLNRRRKQEFGLYHVLGMGKGGLARLLLWQSLMISAAALALGLLCGMALSKLAELGLINLTRGETTTALRLPPAAAWNTAATFCVIFALQFLNDLRQIRFSSTVSLLRAEQFGEKPPKGNWFVALLGFALLGAAYYLAATIQDPLEALLLFFVAVILVIFGTYLVMIAGSVFLCRLLQRNKRYYYRAKHFVSVSTMAYRMKRNGAGLASICILATMVLVMISSTTCLYFGTEDIIRSRYPKQIVMDLRFEDDAAMSEGNLTAIRREIAAVQSAHGAAMTADAGCRTAAISGIVDNGTVEVDPTGYGNLDTSFSALHTFYFIPLEDYNRMAGANERLQNGQALLYFERGDSLGQALRFRGGRSFEIVRALDEFPGSGITALDLVDSVYLIVPDLQWAIQGLDRLATYTGERMMAFHWQYFFDTGLDEAGQIALNSALIERFSGDTPARFSIAGFTCSAQVGERRDFYELYGGLFYLGILLSIVFLLAAVLMIYYKQVSEGYEDQARFEIMQKVGMTNREIRRSINAQLLTVFYLPLLLAALHLTFAFPIIRKLLVLFSLNNVRLYLLTTGLSVLAFALLYMLVYRLTSNVYYRIVSRARQPL